jgi:antitoxin ParD1/3/4
LPFLVRDADQLFFGVVVVFDPRPVRVGAALQAAKNVVLELRALLRCVGQPGQKAEGVVVEGGALPGGAGDVFQVALGGVFVVCGGTAGRALAGEIAACIPFLMPLPAFWVGDADGFVVVVVGGADVTSGSVVPSKLRLLEDHETRVRALEAALVEGENSGEPRPFDFDAFKARKRAEYERG